MTAPVSLLPVSTTVDMATGTSLPATDSAENGETNPFTQLLQGIVAIQNGTDQPSGLPFMVELSVNGELDSEGSLLPDQGQSLALSDLINPFMSLSMVDGQQQASLNLPATAGISVLDNKSAATLPGYLAAMSALQSNNPALRTKEATAGAQLMKGADVNAVVLPELASQQKFEQAVAGMANKMAVALEQQVSAKADNSTLSLTTNTQNLSAINMATAGTSARVDATSLAPPITVPPQNPAWTQQVGERMQWMINQKMQKVEIRLDPPELGSMEVRIVMNKDQAQVTFAAPSAQVRDALEAALPRLREMMSEQGLNLADVDVGQHSLAQQNSDKNTEDFAENGTNDAGDNAVVEQVEDIQTGRVLSSNGILDAYV